MTRAWVLVAVLAAACDPVRGTALSSAPQNVCAEHPCEAYAPGPRTKPVCNGNEGMCEIQGRPDYAFTILVNVPTGSYYAPGYTFRVPSSALYSPPKTPSRGQCSPPSCLALPLLTRTTGSYSVLRKASEEVGYPLPDPPPDLLSLPVRVLFVPLAASGIEALAAGFPEPVRFTASELSGKTIAYHAPLPAGDYLRLSYPEPPFDAYFPPMVDEVTIAGDSSDHLTLGALQSSDVPGTRQLDDPSGDQRRAHVHRDEGLDGFRIWLADSKSGRRVSVVRALSGVDAETRLDTTGQSQGTGTALRDGIDVVVAPPDAAIAMPRLQSTLIGGQGLRDLVYPPLPARASLSGVVATRGTDGTLTGIPAQLAIESETVYLDDGTPSPLLRYRTTLSTDGAGRFATVVPPGLYDVVIEPAEGTGFGKVRKVLDVSGTRAATLEPPPRTVALGQAALSDGRPLATAQVLAMPSRVQPDAARLPRAGRAMTGADGRFQLELDQGSYDVTIVPEAGSGFPRVVTTRAIGGAQEDIGTLVVPVPMRIPLTVRAPSASEAPGLPIARAVLRVFAEPVGGGPAVEIASAFTDPSGKCEILLAQQPR